MSTLSIFEETVRGGNSAGFEAPAPAALLSPRQTRLVLAKERMRCDRFGHHFSAILLSLRPGGIGRRKQLAILADLLRTRLRLTDEYGLLEDGRVAVVLPMTGRVAGEAVLVSLNRMAAQRGIAFDADVVTYPSEPTERFDDPALQDTIAEGCDPIDDRRSGDAVAESCINGAVATMTHSAATQFRGGSPRGDAVGPLIERYPTWKRLFDVVAAGTGLLLALPVIVSAAIAIRLTSTGAVFYLQERTGQHGRNFKIIKLRTMVANADAIKPLLLELNERDGPAFKMYNDPRVTRVGWLLRRTGIDELPQLINVLKGEMAIVGPRPLPCSEQAECEPWQHRRLDTKPGLTCYWQISKRRKVSFAEWMRMDLRYSARRSPFCDAQLIVRTCASVLLGRVGH